MTPKVSTIQNETMRRKQALETRLKELTGTFGEREELQIEYQADPLDQVRASTEREMTVQRLDSQTRLIHDIQEALAKIEHGSYGVCEECEEPIPPKRLNAVPWARFCVACQSQRERQTQAGVLAFDDAA
jgi:DnaK suppressor protein